MTTPTGQQRLDAPQYVGEVSVVEMSELRLRLDMIEKAEADIKVAEERLMHLRRLKAVLTSEHDFYIQSIYHRRGLPASDVYQIAEDTGVIARTARAVPSQPEVVPDPQPAPSPALPDQPAMFVGEVP